MDDLNQPNTTAPLMKELTREQIWDIWQAGKRGEALSAEDARLFEIMEGHLQHGALWDRLNVATDDEVIQNGVNLVLHILFHQAIENQIATSNPAATAQVMKVLKQKGMKEHDAAHALASVLAWEMYDMLKRGRAYDEARYVRELRKLPMKVKVDARRKK
jgi:hypothetical protein